MSFACLLCACSSPPGREEGLPLIWGGQRHSWLPTVIDTHYFASSNWLFIRRIMGRNALKNGKSLARTRCRTSNCSMAAQRLWRWVAIEPLLVSGSVLRSWNPAINRRAHSLTDGALIIVISLAVGFVLPTTADHMLIIFQELPNKWGVDLGQRCFAARLALHRLGKIRAFSSFNYAPTLCCP